VLIVVLLLIATPGIVWLGHAVCTPIPEEELKSFTPVPVEQRHDRYVFLFATFERHNGEWCQLALCLVSSSKTFCRDDRHDLLFQTMQLLIV
jgi:hypothetical protein